MLRRRLVGTALVALLGATAAAEPLPFRPATAADLGIAMDASRVPSPTASFEVEVGCGQILPRAAFVDLAWSGLDTTAASARRVDISKLREGFATGRFETTGAQPASLSEVRVQAPEPAVRYYWRVLTQGPEGWVSSRVERFRVPVCRADVLEANQATGLRLNGAPSTAAAIEAAPAPTSASADEGA